MEVNSFLRKPNLSLPMIVNLLLIKTDETKASEDYSQFKANMLMQMDLDTIISKCQLFKNLTVEQKLLIIWKMSNYIIIDGSFTDVYITQSDIS